MKIDRSLSIENIARTRDDISKKKIIELYDFLTDKTENFFDKKAETDISVYFSSFDNVRYDSIDEFQKNFSESTHFESINLYSSSKLSERIHLGIRYRDFSYDSKLPFSAYVSVSCNNKTEVEVEDLLLEIKDFVVDLFPSSEEKMKNTDTNNAQPTDHSNEKFWIKHKPLLDFLYLVLGIVISVATIIGLFKSCNGNTVNNEINENQTLYSQQNEITSVADTTTHLS